jgi:hypothetical protein
MHKSDNSNKSKPNILTVAAMAATYLLAVGIAFTLALGAGLHLLEG